MDPLQVVVFAEQGHSVGLVVNRILDIVEEAITVEHKSKYDGVLGAAVIQGHVTDLLDVRSVIRKTDPSFLERPEPAEVSA